MMQFFSKGGFKALATQTRTIRHAPKYLRGKMYALKVAEKRRFKKFLYKARGAKPPPKKSWEPVSENDKKFKELFESLQHKSKSVPILGFHELVKMAKTSDEIRRTCLIFKLMVCKFYTFSTETSNLMTKMFLSSDMMDVALEVLKNSVLFKLEYSEDTVFGQVLPALIKSGDFENANSVFSLVIEGKVRGIEEASIHHYYKYFSLLDLENESHSAKIMEYYEKMKKPKVPLIGFHTPLFIERLGKVYEILAVAAEKAGKDVEKVVEEKTKYNKYSQGVSSDKTSTKSTVAAQ